MVTIAGVSALDNNSTLANAGVAYIILKDWSERGKGEDLAVALRRPQPQPVDGRATARVLVLPPPPIQGIGNAAGFTMQVELRDGSFDLAKLQGSVNAHGQDRGDAVGHPAHLDARSAPACRNTGSRSTARRSQALGLTTDQVFSTLAGYLGSTYVNQFNKFGRVFQVYVQGDAQFRLTPEAIAQPDRAQQERRHDPARHRADDHAERRPVADQPLQSLSVGDDRRRARRPASRPARRSS